MRSWDGGGRCGGVIVVGVARLSDGCYCEMCAMSVEQLAEIGLLWILRLIECESSFRLKNEGFMQLMQIALIHSNAHRLEC